MQVLSLPFLTLVACHAPMRAEQPKRGKWCIWFYMCSSYVYAFHVLVRSCWQENHLDRLVSRFVASPVVHCPSGVATSFLRACCQSNWVPHLCLKVSCRSFCSQKPGQRHGVGPLQRQTRTQEEEPLDPTHGHVACCARHTWRFVFFCAIVCCFHVVSVHQESSQWRRWG